MNKINSKKLYKSKWTAVKPENREKHFIVTEVEFDEAEIVISCCIEAVLSKRSIQIQCEELKDLSKWLQGWK